MCVFTCDCTYDNECLTETSNLSCHFTYFSELPLVCICNRIFSDKEICYSLACISYHILDSKISTIKHHKLLWININEGKNTLVSIHIILCQIDIWRLIGLKNRNKQNLKTLNTFLFKSIFTVPGCTGKNNESSM